MAFRLMINQDEYDFLHLEEESFTSRFAVFNDIEFGDEGYTPLLSDAGRNLSLVRRDVWRKMYADDHEIQMVYFEGEFEAVEAARAALQMDSGLMNQLMNLPEIQIADCLSLDAGIHMLQNGYNGTFVVHNICAVGVLAYFGKKNHFNSFRILDPIIPSNAGGDPVAIDPAAEADSDIDMDEEDDAADSDEDDGDDSDSGEEVAVGGAANGVAHPRANGVAHPPLLPNGGAHHALSNGGAGVSNGH